MKIAKSQITLIVILIGTVLFSYCFTKANVSSFTHDESFTYLNYPHDSFMDIISFSKFYTNNHILNSLFMKYSEQLFGNSELALRLPNLILLLVYMCYAFLLFRTKNALLRIEVFLLLCTNVLLMDLFGLARGYGMSFGFMLMSLYHFIAYIKKSRKKDLALFHFAALLASLSNFTLVTFYAALLMVYSIHTFINTRFVLGERFRFVQKHKVHIIPLLLVGIVLYEPIRRVLMQDTLNFGGKKGFYADTIAHLVSTTFHNAAIPSSVLLIAQLLVTIIVLTPLCLMLKDLREKRNDFFTKQLDLVISTFLLISISIIIVLQHLLLKSDYPISRFAVFLFPLFIVHVGFFFDYLIGSGFKKISLMILTCIALASAISFWNNTNLSSSAEWAYDSETKNMIQTLADYRATNPDQFTKINLGVNWLFEPTINFYRETQQLDWLSPVDRKGISEANQYLYIFEKEFKKMDMSKYEVIKVYQDIGTLLVKNKMTSNKE